MTAGVAHVLTSPGNGGVPRVVRALVSRIDRRRYEPSVFFLKPGEGLDVFRDLDATVEMASIARGKTGAIAAPTALNASMTASRSRSAIHVPT